LKPKIPNKDIYLYVNSPGGSVTDGPVFFDTMQHIKPECSDCMLSVWRPAWGFFASMLAAPGKAQQPGNTPGI